MQGRIYWPCNHTDALESKFDEIRRKQVIGSWLTAFSDYKDDGTNILLDANENAYGPGLDLADHHQRSSGTINGDSDERALEIDLLGLNRYPDPQVLRR